MTATTLYTNCTTPQLQLHSATTTSTAAVHHTTSSSCGWGDHCNHCNHSNKHNSNHLSVNQWIRSAIRDSQQQTSPIGFPIWNFRHRLVRYYWNMETNPVPSLQGGLLEPYPFALPGSLPLWGPEMSTWKWKPQPQNAWGLAASNVRHQ